MSDDCDQSLGVAGMALFGATLALVACCLLTLRVNCFPPVFLRLATNDVFLAEYDRRADEVVDHDIKKKYKIGRKLGSGVTSDVFRVTEKSSGDKFALKKIPLKGSESLQRAVEQEIAILKRIKHHHIVALHDTYQSSTTVWAIMELVSGGELSNYVLQHRGWNEAEAARCVHQVLSGMGYLHSQGIVHRDIKMANLLRSDQSDHFEVKIADFGASTVVRVPRIDGITEQNKADLTAFKMAGSLRDCIGTPCNMAPEVFNHQYGPMADMWSLGCVVYELLVGEPPFDPYKLPADNPEWHLKRNVRAAKYPTNEDPSWRALSPEAASFVQRLLTAAVAERMSAWEAQRHEWLGGRLMSMKSKEELTSAQQARKRRKESLIASPDLSGVSGAASDKTQPPEAAAVSGSAPPLHVSPAQIAVSQPRRKESMLKHNSHEMAAAAQQAAMGEESPVVAGGGETNNRHTAVALYDPDGYDERRSVSSQDKV